ncbi:MAG: 2OG-Fe(II) oxygenase [Nitrososphaeria archaeon]|nr:2OG-Fe(II) oxygenase [Nitrososphaeria archaeon]
MLNKVMVFEDVANVLDLKISILNEYEKRKNNLISHHTGYRMAIEKNMPETLLLNKLFNPYLKEYIEKFNLEQKQYNFSDWILMGWTVPGRTMEPHNDHTKDVSLDLDSYSQPILTAILYLAHDCEGGDLNFPNLNFKITPKTGTLVIFPSEEIHEVLKYISGERILVQKFVFNT